MPSRSTRTAGIVLALVGLVAVVVAVVLLVRPGAGDPTATPGTTTSSPASSATSTASAAPTLAPEETGAPTATVSPSSTGVVPAAPAEPAAAPVVVSFTSSPASVDCAGDRTASRIVSLSWETTGGATARLAVGTTDAQAGDTVDLSASGYAGISVACRDAETLITLSVESADGSVAQRSVVVTTEE